MNNDPRPEGFRSIHRTLADPIRLRVLDALWVKPRSAKELSAWVQLPPDRLYYHLHRLEQAGLIKVADYRELPRGKVERVYSVAESEPLDDDASPEDEERFLTQLLEATTAEVGAAYRAKAEGADRRVTLYRGGARVSRKHLEEIRALFEQTVRTAYENPDDDGVWTRIVFAFVDLENRTGERPVSEDRKTVENTRPNLGDGRAQDERAEGASS